MSLKELKQYLRVDYTDDDSMIELMHDAVIDEMKELIPSLDPEKPTNRLENTDLFVCEGIIRSQGSNVQQRENHI